VVVFYVMPQCNLVGNTDVSEAPNPFSEYMMQVVCASENSLPPAGIYCVISQKTIQNTLFLIRMEIIQEKNK
jgi:hypothetical protein